MTLFDRWMRLFGWSKRSDIPWRLCEKIMALPLVENEDWRRYKRRVNKVR